MPDTFWQELNPSVNGPINIGLFSMGIRRIPHLPHLLGCDAVHFRPGKRHAQNLTAVAGWGNKATAEKARAYAHRHKLPFVALEDGWVRSLGLSGRWAQPLSMVRDDVGIYYDATAPSRLENLIAAGGFDDDLLKRARRLRRRLVSLRISKYNHAPPAPLLAEGAKVLVVDQTFGDLSIRYGLADDARFARMLTAALDEHPDATVYLKVHPEVVAGKKQGHFDLEKMPERVKILSEDMNPLDLIEQMDHVHVVSSQLGFEALLMDKPVTCHGMPYYAGWGLTDDRVQCERRGVERSLDDVFAAAYLLYSRYLNPARGKACELEELLDYLALQLHWTRRNQGRNFCVGFRYWKRYIARAFLQGPGSETRFHQSLDEAIADGLAPGDSVVMWSSRLQPSHVEACEKRGVRLTRMEDGFLRSVGLGSDFVTPLSLVLDKEGIYYDPERPSELEQLLNSAAFSDDELERAGRLRERISSRGVTKYNLSADQAGLGARLSQENERVPAPGQVKILVPGQVEDDASVRHGGGEIQSNLSLLQRVREKHPDAFILYKPHPDVVAGNRKAKSSEVELRAQCDAYLSDADMSQCLRWADELHTLTSLSGFEALLRDIPVAVYGAPFYAGWGLTRDDTNLPQRARNLTLDELVAGVLIRYPCYYDWEKRVFATPEQTLERILHARRTKPGLFVRRLPLLRHGIIKCRQLMNIVKYS